MKRLAAGDLFRCIVRACNIYMRAIIKIHERRSKMLGYDFEHNRNYPNIQANILDAFF
jgi:hypothetical protein